MSKRYGKLPEKTSELPADVIEKLIPVIKKNCTTKFDESVDLSFQTVSYTHLTLPTTPYV